MLVKYGLGLAFIAGCSLLTTGFSAWAANAAPSAAAAALHGGETAVIKVHVRSHRHGYRHQRHLHHHRRRHVDAPFTHVETQHGKRRRVIFEVPFTSVYVGRHGRHIRAPFVNLWIPR